METQIFTVVVSTRRFIVALHIKWSTRLQLNHTLLCALFCFEFFRLKTYPSEFNLKIYCQRNPNVWMTSVKTIAIDIYFVKITDWNTDWNCVMVIEIIDREIKCSYRKRVAREGPVGPFSWVSSAIWDFAVGWKLTSIKFHTVEPVTIIFRSLKSERWPKENVCRFMRINVPYTSVFVESTLFTLDYYHNLREYGK